MADLFIRTIPLADLRSASHSDKQETELKLIRDQDNFLDQRLG